MIGLLVGTIIEHKNPVIILVGGVGYNVFVPESLREKLSKRVTLFIHTHVTDDAITLYGFSKEEELKLYELLLTVSGIGPKTALAIIDQGSKKIGAAISTSDVDFFTSIPRLGKKNAQKIIIELKSKLGSTGELDLETNGEANHLRDALSSMGFERNEISEALRNSEGKTIEEKLRHALKSLGK